MTFLILATVGCHSMTNKGHAYTENDIFSQPYMRYICTGDDALEVITVDSRVCQQQLL